MVWSLFAYQEEMIKIIRIIIPKKHTAEYILHQMKRCNEVLQVVK